MNREATGASFRDPCGHIFFRDGQLLRQINIDGKEDFLLFMQSGLYQRLLDAGLVIAHHETSEPPADEKGWKVIKPAMIPFVSYPWEWCFEALHTAAIATLHICRIALEHGMVLKDASAFNIQFNGVEPVLIDTLSFTRYREGTPWIAYGQFCRHFLAPLLLGAKKDIRIVQLFRRYLDGIPLDLAVRLSPWYTRLNFALMIHIHLHAALQVKKPGRLTKRERQRSFSKNALMGLLDSLEAAVGRLRIKRGKSEWSDYHDRMNYSDESFSAKQRIVEGMLVSIKPASVWDMGANDGAFSRIAGRHARAVISFDADHEVVNRSFIYCRQKGVKNILPLLTDLTNPGPACGWAHKERMSLEQRGPADCLMALALVHHLAIGNNLSFEQIAEYFSDLARNVIIEFIPKHDTQAALMLSSREDIFHNYSLEYFERTLARCFSIEEKAPIAGCQRILYRLKNKTNKKIMNISGGNRA